MYYLMALSLAVSDPTFVKYEYEAVVIKAYDADTIDLQVDLGFHISIKERFRLYRINAWEVTGKEKPEGIVARDWFRSELAKHDKVYIRTVKDKKGKYGRYLCDLFVLRKNKFVCLNDELVRLGHAKYQEY